MRAVKIDPSARAITEIQLPKNPNRTTDELRNIIGQDIQIILLDWEICLLYDASQSCKNCHTFTFFGNPDLVIPGKAVVLACKGSKFKSLEEKLRSFELSVEFANK